MEGGRARCGDSHGASQSLARASPPPVGRGVRRLRRSRFDQRPLPQGQGPPKWKRLSRRPPTTPR
eukprot:2035232-Alexandrium_andersonii.AAC.1